MRSLGNPTREGGGGDPRPEVDQIEQWVAEQLERAPALSPEQLGRLRLFLAATPSVGQRAS
jgi:hypothetical protein